MRIAAARPVLHAVNLHIRPGQTVALVGPTGAGKTSIANLVARFYDVTEGAVLIDGIDVRSVTQASLRGQFGLAPQDAFLFSGTVADNIRFSRPARQRRRGGGGRPAGERTHVHHAAARGYQTEVWEGGVNLSAGERQLISIARAGLAQPRILILDEATSSVDTVTELLIQDALERLLAGRTALVIAHRLSTIRKARPDLRGRCREDRRTGDARSAPGTGQALPATVRAAVRLDDSPTS